MYTSIAIVADFDSNSRSHIATTDAIKHSCAKLGIAIDTRWIHTADLRAQMG